MARKHEVRQYVVVGSGRFPVDMLRYDSAWPSCSEDAVSIEDTFVLRPRREQTAVKLQSYSDPTRGRWESFGWRVLTMAEYLSAKNS